MNATNTASSGPLASRLWMAAMALCSFLSAIFAGLGLFMAVAHERSLLRDPAVMGGMMLLFAGATYGVVEVTRRWRRRASWVSLPLGVLFVVVVFFSGGVLMVRGLLMRKHSAETRILEDLRVVEGGE